ncbi:2'-5' RNA ligase family protein [Streptomyces sp. NPDC002536]
MKDFWETHHWPQGERRAHWHVLFDDQPTVHTFVRAHAELLGRHRELAPIPVEWLHATIQSVGPLSPGQADAVAAAAQLAARDIAPFELEVGPAQAVHNGVIAALYPEEQISALYRTLRQVTESVLGTGVLPSPRDARFWPHMSLAYSSAHWDSDALAEALVKLRPPRARMTVTRAVLVDQQQLWRDRYTWTPIAEIQLGQGPRPVAQPAAARREGYRP